MLDLREGDILQLELDEPAGLISSAVLSGRPFIGRIRLIGGAMVSADLRLSEMQQVIASEYGIHSDHVYA